MVHKNSESTADDLGADTAIERALVALIRAVLSRDQQLLLTAFDAIIDPQVRQSLIKLARAAADDGGGAARPEPSPPQPRDHCFEIYGEIHLRRVRGELRHLCVKDVEGQGS